jgi:hypothetical protein
MPDEVQQEMDQVLVIDGVEYSSDDLTFREQRKMRDMLKQLTGGDVEEASIPEFYMALIYTVKKRDNPELDIEEVLDWKLKDFLQDRPTKQAENPAEPVES